jgi:hypothetical protein
MVASDFGKKEGREALDFFGKTKRLKKTLNHKEQ